MKNLVIISAVTAGLSILRMAHAQGIVYLSNLGQPSAGNLVVGSDSWLAAGFHTGTNPGGYMLDSVQLAMASASGNPNGFTVMIYNEANNPTTILPGNSLDILSGPSNPSTTDVYTYTASSLVLNPSTHYFIVLNAGTTVASGAYEWNVLNTASYNPSDGWIGSVTLISNNGSSWRTLPTYPSLDFSQYAITATAIPEPPPAFLLLLGSGVLFYVRRIFHR
jgi:hypothetical protein